MDTVMEYLFQIFTSTGILPTIWAKSEWKKILFARHNCDDKCKELGVKLTFQKKYTW